MASYQTWGRSGYMKSICKIWREGGQSTLAGWVNRSMTLRTVNGTVNGNLRQSHVREEGNSFWTKFPPDTPVLPL